MTYNTTNITTSDGNITALEFINITSTIPSNSFFSVGFGESLYNTDVIMFRAFSSLKTFEVDGVQYP